MVPPPTVAAGKSVIVRGVELGIREASGMAALAPTKEQMVAILKAAGNDIVVDRREYAGIDFRAAAEWFKDIDKELHSSRRRGATQSRPRRSVTIPGRIA